MFNLVVPNEVVALGKIYIRHKKLKAFLTGLQDMQDFLKFPKGIPRLTSNIKGIACGALGTTIF